MQSVRQNVTLFKAYFLSTLSVRCKDFEIIIVSQSLAIIYSSLRRKRYQRRAVNECHRSSKRPPSTCIPRKTHSKRTSIIKETQAVSARITAKPYHTSIFMLARNDPITPGWLVKSDGKIKRKLLPSHTCILLCSNRNNIHRVWCCREQTHGWLRRTRRRGRKDFFYCCCCTLCWSRVVCDLAAETVAPRRDCDVCVCVCVCGCVSVCVWANPPRAPFPFANPYSWGRWIPFSLTMERIPSPSKGALKWRARWTRRL